MWSSLRVEFPKERAYRLISPLWSEGAAYKCKKHDSPLLLANEDVPKREGPIQKYSAGCRAHAMWHVPRRSGA